jgi:transposase-like protein
MKTNLPSTLLEAVRYFNDAERCIEFFAAVRWPNGVSCPICGNPIVSYLAKQQRWQCSKKHPKRQFSVKAGTVFEDSPIPLEKWLPAVWLLVNCKNGVSSYEVAKALDVTQKTAWFMMHRVRLAMQQGSFNKMSGQIEVDETYVGGLARNMHKDKKAQKITGTGGSGKAIVMGLLERHGSDKTSKVRAKVVRNTSSETLQGEIRQQVTPGSEVFTDALSSYRGLDPEYVHQFIDHAETYVRGSVHTNGIENFWSLLKRSIRGSYVSVEPWHLHRYVDEQAFRFNERKVTDGERFAEVMANMEGKRLTYQKLTGKDEPSPA